MDSQRSIINRSVLSSEVEEVISKEKCIHAVGGRGGCTGKEKGEGKETVKFC